MKKQRSLPTFLFLTTTKLLKTLKVPVVIANIHGAYITNPKWREKRIKGPVHTEVKYIISKEQIIQLRAVQA